MSEQTDRLEAVAFRLGQAAAVRDQTHPPRYPGSDLPYRSRNPFPLFTTSLTAARLHQSWSDGYATVRPPDLTPSDRTGLTAEQQTADAAAR